MWNYLRHLLQLLLSPSRGWEDVAASGLTYDIVQRRGFFPLAFIAALSEFIPLMHNATATFTMAIGSAIAMGGGLFASLFAARLFLDITLTKFINNKINILKVNNVVVYMLGFDCLYRIFSNMMPASMTFLMFLPLISLIILFKSTTYLNISEDKVINFLLLSFIGVIIIPAAICALLMLII